MIAIAYGFQAISAQSGSLHGLKLAAVAVVAQAVWTMAVKLCPDRERVTLALEAACVVLRGANAAVVGILLAALYNPVWTVAVDSSVALIIALAYSLSSNGSGSQVL